MATDAYGLSDLSLLTAPQQETARNISDAFKASAAARDRNLARYGMAAPSAPMMAEMENTNALQQAITSSNLMNQNQQIQNLIDASHATPHGVAQNLAAYLPMLGNFAKAWPLLFGTDSTLSQGGLYGLAQQGLGKVASWFHNPATNQTYPLDANGNIVGFGNTTLGGAGSAGVSGISTLGDTGWNPGAANVPTNWGAGFDTGTTAASTYGIPQDFGTAATAFTTPLDTSSFLPSAADAAAQAPSDIASFFG